MNIKQVVCAPGRTGFYFDDQAAIKKGAETDGNLYVGQPVTPGFRTIRTAGEAISVMLVLEDGQIAYGDCAAVQYSGAGGRDPLFLAKDFIPVIESVVAPALIGQDVSDFKTLVDKAEALKDKNGQRLHTAIRYGVSQALLDAAAKATHRQMCDVVAEAYGTTVSETRIPIFSQSGDDRMGNADKMIMKMADVLPHALINNTKTKLGLKGELLKSYLIWLDTRVKTARPDPTYNPIFHIDVYGTIGELFGVDNVTAMADYIMDLEATIAPRRLRIEGPMDAGSRDGQIKALKALTDELKARKSTVELVADEWCNTYEDVRDFVDAGAGHMIQIKTPDLGGIQNTAKAVIYCKEHGVGAYLGGTCNETDRSAQVSVHVALAVGADQLLAKPGMGVDEGYMIVNNEMERTLALRKALARA